MEVGGGFHILPRFNRECDKYNGGCGKDCPYLSRG